MKQNRWIPGFALFLLLAMLACTIPGVGPGDGPAATPTPLGDTLSFAIPAYTYSLEQGETIPGTQLRYVERSGDTYKVTIDGLEAIKRTGDSFLWDGLVAPGVYANYNLRLTTAVFGSLPVAGSVEITVFYPQPVALDELPNLDTALDYRNTVVNYLIPAGRQIPGTSLVYSGLSDQQEGDKTIRLAQLTGLTGYPYLAVGDSLHWQGSLLNNVVIENNMRVISINEDGLRLAGTANLWILQP
ncbi:MAG: hypothetical protein R3E31_24060 [Chloroflexota bacterium]|nr:hypothetical protein [Anaerolineales bacterium]MCA9976763.1 hypothetical protein [Anaerolineales bacterium]MCB8967109.1 hypothetical protein [Ardenticatenaceae bacterium]MCB8989105.1 hypothetical protein [Ardenticatenaceae bacterium]